jgi:hypothetical protein
MGVLDPPKEIREKLLKSKYVPDQVKARMGDKAAEKRVIAAFEKASAEEKGKYAEYVLYVDSPDCIRAFLRGLESEATFEPDDLFAEKQSVAWSLMEAYARGPAESDAKIFSYMNTSPHLHLKTEAEFQKPEHQRFLRDVERFFEDRYGIKIHIRARYLVLGGSEIVE